MKGALLELFASKKFLTALTAIIVYLAGRFGFDIDTQVLDRIYAALLVYIGAQGIADNGKSAAQVTARAAAASSMKSAGGPVPSAASSVSAAGVAGVTLALVAISALSGALHVA